MKILAGIVLFNPDMGRLKENIDSVYEQVDRVVLVDNSSKNREDIIRLAEKYAGCELLLNEDNLGVAKALNQIFEYAHVNEYDWFLTLDQDSVCKEGLLEHYGRYCQTQRVGIMTCQIADRNFGFDSRTADGEYEEVKFCITSGAFMKTSACVACGGFDEKMFIDNVDGDICINMREHGYRIIKIPFNGLLHEVGHGERKKLLRKAYYVYHHPVMRHYYIARNKVYAARKYPHEYHLTRQIGKCIKDILPVLLWEEDGVRKAGARFKGIRDGLKMEINRPL